MVNRIEDLLPVGRKNAITTEELLKRSGYKTARALQQQIAIERKEGALIMSGNRRGYWKPANREEIQEYIRNMESRGKHIFEAVRSAREALEELPGQVQINDVLLGIEDD